MANPLSIIPLMFRARRPRKMNDMRAVDVPFWIGNGYMGMTFFGAIITHCKEDSDVFNNSWNVHKNHEMIHLYQARDTHNSWLCFYWKYIFYWLKGCCYRKHLKNAGYLLNPFEMEAYDKMHDLHYLDDKENGTTEWRRYAKMSLEERLRLYLARNSSACD